MIAIHGLRQEYKVVDLIGIAGIPRSTYYAALRSLEKPDKYEEVKDMIRQICSENKGRYGYRRVTLELRNRGYKTNHKTVYHLIRTMDLQSRVRLKKYRSYRGEVGFKAPNLLERDFKATHPSEKWVTDITEIHAFGRKIYLSPILDLYNGEIISYTIGYSPGYELVGKMLDMAFEKIPDDTNLILHSDQGWQYQWKRYQEKVKKKGIRQSMSRKGNCLDNAVMENFFGLLKTELIYLKKFDSIETLIEDVREYMNYYNNDRIKVKLNGMSPVKYRAMKEAA